MSIRCPECLAEYNNDISMNFKLEDSIVFQMFGRKSAEIAHKKQPFIILEDNSIVCETCRCRFLKNGEILNHSPLFEEFKS